VCKHSTSAKLQGLLGKPQLAQYADLAFRLKTDTEGQHITLRLRQPGLLLPEAKEILLAHQDLEDAGFLVNYHTGKVRDPGVHVLTMIKNGTVWQIPVLPPRKHTVLAATTTVSDSKTLDVDRMHEVFCCVGTTTMLRYYDYYNGTGFGKAASPTLETSDAPSKRLCRAMRHTRDEARAQKRYMRMRRTWTTRTFLIRVVQTNRLNSSSSQAHGPYSAVQPISHQS
jgi:hypothetical protein